MAEQLANDVQTLLVNSLTAGATKLVPMTTAGFPAAEYRIRIDDELMLVKGTGPEWTVERGVEGTTPAAHEAGSAIYHLLTKAALIRVIGQEAATSAELANEKSAREAADALALQKSGGTMTGAITLPGNPGANLQAAPKQYVDSAIAALVNGAPETFDTLKEISDQLKLDEEAETALIALVAQKLAKSANLSDLANAATARENLGLGSAAVQAASAFQAADEDLTKIAAETTTAIGRSLLAVANAAAIRTIASAASLAELAAEITAREAAIQARVEELAREGAPEKFWPALAGFHLWKTQALIPAANSGHLLRWVPPRNMTLRGISFMTTVAATNNDECAVALKDTDGKTNLAKSLGTASVLNSSPTTRKDVDFTGDVAVTGGHVYYLGFQYGTVGGTAASLLSAEVNNGNSVGGVWGTAAGLAYVGQCTPTFPFATETAFSTASNRVFMIAHER